MFSKLFLGVGLLLSFNFSYANICTNFLAVSENAVEKLRPMLSLSHAIGSKAHTNLLRYKYDGLGFDVSLQEISKYLGSNGVKHTLDNDIIIISIEGTSTLNRFARRVAQASNNTKKYPSAGITQVVFDPVSLKKDKANGQFEFYPIEDKIENRFHLSIDSIINIKPSLTEFHEIIHWKNFFRTMKMDLGSIDQGYAAKGQNLEGTRRKKPRMIYSEPFALDEFQAHLMGMTMALNILHRDNATEREMDDARYEVSVNSAALNMYISQFSPILADFFQHSQLLQGEENPKDIFSGEFSINSQSINYSSFDWIESVDLQKGIGDYSHRRVLSYQFLKNSDLAWVSLYIPLPEQFSHINNFKKVDAIELEKLNTYIAKTVHLKMIYLEHLVEFIENLNTLVEEDYIIDFSPIQKFHEINLEFKLKVEHLKP